MGGEEGKRRVVDCVVRGGRESGRREGVWGC